MCSYFHVCVAVLLQVKKASAETEPAWQGAGQKVGIQIWRIVKFKVRGRSRCTVLWVSAFKERHVWEYCV